MKASEYLYLFTSSSWHHKMLWIIPMLHRIFCSIRLPSPPPLICFLYNLSFTYWLLRITWQAKESRLGSQFLVRKQSRRRTNINSRLVQFLTKNCSISVSPHLRVKYQSRLIFSVWIATSVGEIQNRLSMKLATQSSKMWIATENTVGTPIVLRPIISWF